MTLITLALDTSPHVYSVTDFEQFFFFLEIRGIIHSIRDQSYVYLLCPVIILKLSRHKMIVLHSISLLTGKDFLVYN